MSAARQHLEHERYWERIRLREANLQRNMETLYGLIGDDDGSSGHVGRAVGRAVGSTVGNVAGGAMFGVGQAFYIASGRRSWNKAVAREQKILEGLMETHIRPAHRCMEREVCQQALRLYEEALVIMKSHGIQKNLMFLANVHTSIANAHGRLENDNQAVEYYTLSNTFLKEIGSTNKDAETARASNFYMMGQLYHEGKNHEKALECFQKALRKRERNLGANNVVTAYTQRRIADVYADLKDHKTALQHYEKAVKVFKSVRGKEDELTSEMYFCMASEYMALDKRKKALQLFSKVEKNLENTLGPNSVETGVVYSKIGFFHLKESTMEMKQKVKERAMTLALEYLAKAIKAYTANQDLLSLSNLHWDIAEFYEDQKMYNKALESHEESIRVDEHRFGIDDVKTAASFAYMAKQYKKLGSTDSHRAKAIEYYKRAATIRETELGINAEKTGEIYGELGLLYEEDKSCREQALICFKKAEKACRFNNDTRELSNMLFKIGQQLQEAGDFSALGYYKESLELWEETMGEQHIMTAYRNEKIGDVLWYLGKDGISALPYYKKVLQIEKSLHEDRMHVRCWIAHIYFESGNYEDAMRYYEMEAEFVRKEFGEEHEQFKYARERIHACSVELTKS